ncbi:MAG: hypothetical protein ACYTFA_06235, partial [Planctomycetota bacterium]
MLRNTCFHLRAIVFIGYAAMVTPGYAQPTGYEGYQVVRIAITDQAELRTLKELQRLGGDFEVWSEVVGIGPMEVRIAPVAKPALDTSGLRYEVTVEDLQQYIDEQYRAPRGGGFFDSLQTYYAHVQFMEGLAGDHPDLAEMITVGT